MSRETSSSRAEGAAALFNPRRHFSPPPAPWDEARARAAVAAFAREAEERFDPRALWPAHPQDAGSGLDSTMYSGAAGVVWALAHLAHEGVVERAAGALGAMRRLYDAFLASAAPGQGSPSLFKGQAGILLIAWRAFDAGRAAERLYELLAASKDHPADDVYRGAPGALLCALHLHRASGEPRWRALALALAERVWSRWRAAPRGRAWLWAHAFEGVEVPFLGAAHGFAGNVHALLCASALLGDADRAELYRRAAATALATARSRGGLSSWPRIAGVAAGDRAWVVQWCHGAPGMVSSLSAVPVGFDPRLDALLARGGEAAWQAGPLRKSSGLCHGTAGNGYAFLKLYRRTGAQVWLDRARLFAMHALAQSERARRRCGQGRFSLWTGDAGLAVYLLACLRADARLPVLEAL